MRMALNKAMKTSTLNIQPRSGGDTALIRGMAEAVLQPARDDGAGSEGGGHGPAKRRRDGIGHHTNGLGGRSGLAAGATVAGWTSPN
jgi:hypothetical protein